MKKIIALVFVLMLIPGFVIATPFNNRPEEGTNLSSLQTLLDGVYGAGLFDVNIQETAAIFQPSVAGPTSSSFLILLEVAGWLDINTFGIYSYSDPSKMLQVFSGPNGQGDSAAVTFQSGWVQLGSDDSTRILNFGTNFGYYITTGAPGTWYSEDDKNPGGWAQMLIYAFPGVPNEYIIACEDQNRNIFSDNDFNDMIIKASEVKPVPEPATMLLLGSGLIGLAGFARRRFRK